MILDRIVSDVRLRLEQRRASVPEGTLRAQVEELPAALDMVAALRAGGVQIIAEVKRASPSRGALAPIPSVGALAATYASAGAAAISVLTEEDHFGGRLADLAEASQALQRAERVPLLRKDFMFDSYQLLDARLAGADAVLLIIAILDDATLAHLHRETVALGLMPLLEVHDEAELERALALSPRLLGINNRNLSDMTVDLATTERLRPRVPSEVVLVSESGIRRAPDVRRLRALGVHAALVGEALVTSDDPATRLRELVEAGR